ncbi:MAG: hypothetical protein V1729_04235 [Candidatus Woesearchaeota archaeon]
MVIYLEKFLESPTLQQMDATYLTGTLGLSGHSHSLYINVTPEQVEMLRNDAGARDKFTKFSLSANGQSYSANTHLVIELQSEDDTLVSKLKKDLGCTVVRKDGPVEISVDDIIEM